MNEVAARRNRLTPGFQDPTASASRALRCRVLSRSRLLTYTWLTPTLRSARIDLAQISSADAPASNSLVISLAGTGMNSDSIFSVFGFALR